MERNQEAGVVEDWMPKRMEHENRMGFIKKVYAILLIQLSLTTFITGLAVYINYNWSLPAFTVLA